MKTNLKLIFSLLIFSINHALAIDYPSCRDAISTNNLDGEYYIKMTPGSLPAKVHCSFENFQIITKVSPENPDGFYSYLGYDPEVTFIYRDISSTDIDKLKTMANNNCYQYVYLSQKNVNSLPYFTFWDNSGIHLNYAVDGICKCLITGPCDDTGDKTKDCYTYRDDEPGYSVSDYGKLAVKPERLPLKSMRIYDVDEDDEYVSFYVYSFICQENAYPKVKNLKDENLCKEKNYTVLFDSKSETCISFFSIEIEFPVPFSNIELQTKNGSCEEIDVFGGKNNKNIINIECKQEHNNKCSFKCESLFKKILLLVKNTREISLCEILAR